MPHRIRPPRRSSPHAPRGTQTPFSPAREPLSRLPARNGESVRGTGHGEDAGPSAEGWPPREDRAG